MSILGAARLGLQVESPVELIAEKLRDFATRPAGGAKPMQFPLERLLLQWGLDTEAALAPAQPQPAPEVSIEAPDFLVLGTCTKMC